MAVAAVVVAFLVSAVAVRLFSRPGSWLYVLDHPNERSLHTSPVPRTGGVAILAGIAAALALSAATLRLDPVLAWILAGALLVAGVSFLDDRMNVHPGLRFLVHLGAALLLLGGGLALGALRLPGVGWAWPAAAAGVFSLLFAIWLINLYNFMDGMDGLAGGMAVFGFGTCALIGALRGHADFASTAAIVAAAAAGFLLFNFPPARIFMGDVGSATLGFLAAAVCLWADRLDVFPLWIGVLAFSPFIVDATVTLARRILEGERPWHPHRTHYYQRLVQLGWGHRRTVVREYGVMALSSASAVGAVYADPLVQWAVCALWIATYVGLALGVTRLERRTRRREA